MYVLGDVFYVPLPGRLAVCSGTQDLTSQSSFPLGETISTKFGNFNHLLNPSDRAEFYQLEGKNPQNRERKPVTSQRGFYRNS